VIYTQGNDLITVGSASVNSGTGDPDYLPAKLMDLKPGVPAKLTTVSGSFVRDLLTDTLVNGMLISHHNLTQATTTIRIMGNATNSWGAPSVNLLITAVAPREDLFPVNIWVDREALVPLAATRTQRYWRIEITTNPTPVIIGEWTLFSDHRFLGVLYGSVYDVVRPAVIHETEVGVLHTYDIGTTYRVYVCEVLCTTAVKDSIESWFRSTQGVTKPVVIIPDPVATSEPMLMKMRKPVFSFSRQAPDIHKASLEFIEVNRGMYP
jgi:hypothetical protein